MEYRLTAGAVVSAVLVLLQGLILACLGYQVILAVASAWPQRPISAAPSRRLRFALAIPAHNEASVLPATLARLREQAYPKELFDVHVVADHCTDSTADVTRQGGAIAHERNDLPVGRKAYALQWLLQRILQQEPGSAASGVHPRSGRSPSRSTFPAQCAGWSTDVARDERRGAKTQRGSTGR